MGEIAKVSDHRSVANSNPKNARYQTAKLIDQGDKLLIERMEMRSDQPQAKNLPNLALSFDATTQSWVLKEE